MTRDEARILISSLIEWYTEDVGERLGMSMGKETYMDALETLWHGPEGDLISRADAIDAVARQWLFEASAESPYVSDDDIDDYRKLASELLSDIPSAEAVSREEYEETDGVITIEKQSAKDVGEIKHIVVCSPNYTRYFYNDSMPTQYKGGEEE